MDNLRKAILVKGNSIVGAVGDKNFSTCPIGVVQVFSGNTIPRGYLACDGASYPTTEYPDLYAVIGNTYGGDTENFNVPDYRETVLVGVGENTTDTIASHDVYELGEFKDDQMESHTHGVVIPNHVGASWQISTTAKAYYSTQTITQTSTASGTGTTTHGKQKGVIYIIKAFHTNEGVDSTNEVSDPIIEYVDNKVEETIDFSSPVYEFNTGSDYTTEVNFEYTTSCKCMILCSITGVPYERVEIDKNAIGRIETNGITLCSVAATGDNSFGMGNSCIVSKGITLSVLLRPRYMQPLNFKVFKIG